MRDEITNKMKEGKCNQSVKGKKSQIEKVGISEAKNRTVQSESSFLHLRRRMLSTTKWLLFLHTSIFFSSFSSP